MELGLHRIRRVTDYAAGRLAASHFSNLEVSTAKVSGLDN
jgi:hypothetical protein